MAVFHEELLGRNIPAAFATFMLGIARAQHVSPIGPRRRRRTRFGRFRHEFHLQHAFAAFADGFAHAVVTRIATADNQDLLALGAEAFGIRFARPVRPMQKVERKEDTFGFAARDFQVARIRRTDGENDFVKILVNVFGRDVLADFGIANELDTGGFEKRHTAVNDGLVQFPVRNAVTE